MPGVHFLSLRRLSILFLTILLMNIGGPAAAFVGDPFLIAHDSQPKRHPSAAYNSQDREYLVVWSTDLVADDDIRAQRVAPDGRLIGGPFTIAWTSGHSKHDPDVVYNIKQNQYLVVFTDTDGSGNKTIRARRVGGKGGVLDTMDLYVQNIVSFRAFGHPAVEYAFTSDRYLIVWEAWDTPFLSSYEIYGRVLLPDGTMPNARFTISSGAWPRQLPALAYNRHQNQNMVLWEQYDSGSGKYGISGIQITGDGIVLPATALNFGWAGEDNRNPDIAALPNSSTNKKFMAVWELNPVSTKNGTASTMISESGVTSGMSSGTDGNSVIRSVVIGSNEGTRTYLEASWYAGSAGKGWFVNQHDQDGYGIGNLDIIPCNSADGPHITAGPLGDYLMIWSDNPSGGTNRDIYGQILGMREYLPLIVR